MPENTQPQPPYTTQKIKVNGFELVAFVTIDANGNPIPGASKILSVPEIQKMISNGNSRIADLQDALQVATTPAE